MSEAIPLAPVPESPSIKTRRLTEAQKLAIVAEVASGKPQSVVAKQFGVNPNTVCTLVGSVRRSKESTVFAADWRTIQQNKALTAVNAGLDCIDDPYKRGALGVQALKGLGVYTPDSIQQVSVLFASVPKELEGDYPTGSGRLDAEMDPA